VKTPSAAVTARFAALGAGLAAGLAHPPFGFLPGLLAYGLLMRLGETAGPRPWRSAFFRGWLAGLGYFAVSVWWVVEPFLVDAKTQGWMAPIALPLMAGGLALFWGAGLLLYRLTRPAGVWRVLVFAGALGLAEWLRGHVLTGFPWNLPGESWRAGSAPSQAAAVFGAYGLTWITVALGASFALVFDPVPRRRRLATGAASLLALAALYGGGALRLAGAKAVAADAPLVRIVQANIDQKEKWRPENLEMIFGLYEKLSRRPGRPDVIVWPEGALPAVMNDLLAPGSPYLSRFTALLGPGQTLLTGANRADLGKAGGVDYFNSLIALRAADPGLEITGIYDKHRLVPFGEFLPLGSLATRYGIRSLVHMPEDFTAGAAPRPLKAKGLPPVQPLICYEALFPGFVSDAARRAGFRPQWLLNVSNDAWFGATSGPWQHLNIASYRAIEEGLPLVRATPTGVSVMVDAYGRQGQRLTLGGLGVIDARLPPALAPPIYSRFGDLIFAALLGLSALAGLGRGFRRT